MAERKEAVMSERKEAVITYAQFAQQAAFLSREAAHWAGDLMGPLPNWSEPVPQAVVDRFIKSIRERLEIVEKWDV